MSKAVTMDSLKVMLSGRATPEVAAERLAREAAAFAAAVRQANAADRALAALGKPGADEARAYVGALWQSDIGRRMDAMAAGYDGVARAMEHRA